MRCTRCDRPVVPQALGRDAEGRLVFGWCLDCLTDAGCTEIEVARTRRPWPPSFRLERLPEETTPDRARLARRRGIVLGLGLALLLWSLLLGFGAAWAHGHKEPGPSSPFGNGTTILLLVGGIGTASTALCLAFLATRRFDPPG